MGKGHKIERQRSKLDLREIAEEVHYLRKEGLDDARQRYASGRLAELKGDYDTAISWYRAAFRTAREIQKAGEKAQRLYNDIADAVESILRDSQLNIMNIQTDAMVPAYFGLIETPRHDS